MNDVIEKDVRSVASGANSGADIVRTPAPGLAERLKQALHGKIRSAVLSRAGVSKRTLARALAGDPIRRDNLLALAAAMGVSRDWLVNGYGPMDLPPPNPTRQQVEELAKQPDLPDPPKETPLFSTLDIKRMATAIDIAEDAFTKRKHNPSSFRKAQVFLTLYDALAHASPNKVRELIHLWDMEDLQQSDQV